MRKAVNRKLLAGVYDHIASHYDCQHGFFTAGSDQRGSRMLVEKTVSPYGHLWSLL